MIIAYGIHLIYLFLLLILLISWCRLSNDANLKGEELPISVIVPFRNETENLAALITSFELQTHSSFEVVFVNDHSEDNGLALLGELLEEVSFKYTILSLESEEGKKAAISMGVNQAQYEIVITTDADCQMKTEWLREMSGPFQDSRLKMIVGPIALSGKSLWQKMQSIESSSLIGVGGAMIKLNRPTMANGANLAYRKSVFKELGGFDEIDETPSGDDELFMMKAYGKYGGGIAFLKSRSAVVSTLATSSWHVFKQQRLRWASKWKTGKRTSTILTALLVCLVQLNQLMLIAVIVFDSQMSLAVLLVSLKFLMEFLFLWLVRQSLGQKMYLMSFVINYLFYPFYALYFGLAANFGSFEWKGRNYKVQN